MYKNHFFSIWRSQIISFNQAIEDLKLNKKIDDNVLSDKHVKSFVNYEYTPKKVQSPLTKMLFNGLET